VSVGHTARVLEANGISTVVIYIRAFRHQAQYLKVPRTVVTPNLLGRTVGRVGDAEGQRTVVRAAVRLLAEATAPGAILDL
jgi:hypothetical protein